MKNGKAFYDDMEIYFDGQSEYSLLNVSQFVFRGYAVEEGSDASLA